MTGKPNEIRADDVKIEPTVDADETLKDLEPKDDVKGGGSYWDGSDGSGS